MSGELKDLITAWQGGGLPVRPIQLSASMTAAVTEKIGLGREDVPRTHNDIAEIRKRLVSALQNENFDKMDFIAWRNSPFCLEGSEGLIHNTLLLEKYLHALTFHLKGRILRALAAVYARTFAADSLATTLLARFLAEQVESMGHKWRIAAGRFQLFVPRAALKLIADALWKTEYPPSLGFIAVLHREGLPPSVALSSLGRQALQMALKQGTVNGSRLESLGVVERIIGLTSDGQGGLALQNHQDVIRGMTDNLLLPFATTASISNHIRVRIESHLLLRLRDPRLERTLWHHVNKDATAVMLNWLTEQSLELFLGIVDKVVDLDENAKRMWQMRGKFWRAYLSKRFIDEAWVVLGDNGLREAQRIQATTENGYKKKLSYAVLTSSSDKKMHIALIMRIDDLIIVDWSHNGRCHIWLSNNSQKPPMYHKHYKGSELAHTSDEQYTHVAGGSWRDRVAQTITRATGRSITARDYS